MRRIIGSVAIVSGLLGGLTVHWLESPTDAPEKANEARQRESAAEVVTRLERERSQMAEELGELRRAARTYPPAVPSNIVPQPTSSGPIANDFQSPISRGLSTEQQIALVRQRNGQIFRELGLSEPQIAAISPLLAQRENRVNDMRTSARKRDSQTGRPLPITADELDSLKQIKSDIVTVIGTEKAERLRQFQRNLPARFEMGMIRNDLALAGEPITDEQQEELIRTVSARVPLRPSGSENISVELAARRRADLEAVLTPRQLELSEESQALHSASNASLSPRLNEFMSAAGAAAP
ncbi:MAG TPA: hypothetical protein VFG30_16040 [Polyangiales bacterium]|nr:hypothetical protein [Polyangiales bacterium]